MKALETLDYHLKNRARELVRAREQGQKIIGYYPGGYVPEEIILACGAVPVGLNRGGEHEPVLIAGAYLPRWYDTFIRSQIGFKVLGGEAIYDLSDLYVVPITDNNVRMLADAWEFYNLGKIFRFGVPHRKTERALKYYLDGIISFKEMLERETGTVVTDEALSEAITLCNRERELFRKVSLLRKDPASGLKGSDCVKLLHASLWLEKRVMVGILESLIEERQQQAAPSGDKGPRILLTGSTLAYGDGKIIGLAEEAGASVVMEHFAEGLRDYRDDVTTGTSPMEALADCYFERRIAPAWFRPSGEYRDHIIELAREYSVDGLIWYGLMYRDSYTVQSTLVPNVIKQATGLSTLVLESDYDLEEVGPLRTRVETFIDMIRH